MPYGRLADGQWRQGIKGHWPDNGKFARPEWWQLVDGALRGQNFADERHPAGLSLRERLVGVENLGLRCRIKIDPESVGIFRVFGKSAGKVPPEKTDNHVTALEVAATGLKLWQGNRVRDDDPRKAGKIMKDGKLVEAPGRFHNTKSEKRRRSPSPQTSGTSFGSKSAGEMSRWPSTERKC